MCPRLIRNGVVLVLVFAVPPGQAGDEPATWPQWRGPTRDGKVSGPAWPFDLKNLKQRWRVELGPSYGGPIVAADRVFVTETQNQKDEVVRALDRKTGKELWQVRWPGAITVPSYAKVNGEWSRSTPAVDGDRLFVAGVRDVLVCLDTQSGKRLWAVDFVERYKTPLPPYGAVSSPLIDSDAIYHQAAAAVVKLEKKTGKVLWRVLPYKSSPNGTAVSSPVIAVLAGKRQLVVQQPKLLAGVDLDSGKLLWSVEVPAFRSINIVTPTVDGDTVLTSAFGGRTQLFKISQSGQKFTATALWSHSAQGYMSSPVIINGHAYLHLRNQRFTCFDLKTGKEGWTTKSFGKYWSLVAHKDRLLALDQTGSLYLIRANPQKFELLDARKVSSDETWAHVVVCGDEVYVRALNALVAYRWSDGRSSSNRP